MFLILFVLTISCLVLFLYVKQKNYDKKYKHLLDTFPNPKGLKYCPVLGNMFMDRRKEKMFENIASWNKDNKSYSFRLPIVGIYAVHVTNAEDAEVILTNTANIKKSRIYDFFFEWLGTGLLTSTGTKWHKRRKMLTPAFHFSILREFVETIVDNSERLVKKLELECEEYETNIKPIISSAALNTICETSMGTKLDSDSKKEINRKYVEAVHKIGKLVVYRMSRPWLHTAFIFNLFMGKKYNSCLQTLHSFTKNVIVERELTLLTKDVGSKLESKSEDFVTKKKIALLDLLLTEKSKNNIDFEGVREEVDTFMFEGHDTISSALVYALNTLANHPEIQDKIIDELEQIFDGGKRRTTYQDLQSMTYLEMCIKESLRLYPSVFAVARHLTEDMTMRNVTVPKDAFCMVHIFAIHRDPKYFPNPEKFDPERFSPENIKGRHPFAYIPFSAGPRNCIGQKYAMLELKSILSEILWHYKIEPVQKTEELTFYLDIILRNLGPVNVKFRRRKHDN